MKRPELIFAIKSLLVVAVLFLSGCVPTPSDPCKDSCAVTVFEPGPYEITYKNSQGNTMTRIVTPDQTGFIVICGCKKILSSVLLVGPPDCSRARTDPATLSNDPERFSDLLILDVTEPDMGLVNIKIDSIFQDEPVFGVFEDDRYPDVLSFSASHASVRKERDPAGNGRVYTINFTATDDEGESCQGSVKVCVPVVEGGTCIDDGIMFDSTRKPEIDLSVAISDSPDPVGVGDNLTYTITVTNNSSVAADSPIVNGTILEVDLFQFINAVSNVSFSSECERGLSGDSLRCNVGRISGRASAAFTVVVTPRAAGMFTNSVRLQLLSVNFTDPDPSNNRATAVTRVNRTGGADLAVTKTASPEPVTVGNDLTYTITVINNGPFAASGVVMTDTLRSSVTFISASNGCTESNGTVNCSPLNGRLANGDTVTFTIVVRPTSAGTLFNGATVTSNVEDQDTSNNFARSTTTVNSAIAADLSVAKTDSPDPLNIGQNLTYNITITNNGPAAAGGVMLTDTLPSSVNFVSASASQGSCNELGSSVTCAIGSLANGAVATVTIVVTPTAAGTISNTATATSNVSDPSQANNTATVTTTVNAAATADLSVTNSDSPDPVNMSSQAGLLYTIVVTNNGPAAAAGVVLTDLLPQQAETGNVTTSQGSFSLSGSTLTVNLGALASGQAPLLPFESFRL